MRKKNLLIAAAMLGLPALANETPTVTVTKSNGENITFEMADMMNGAYLTANAASPLSLVIYTGQITTNENGEFVVDETNPQPGQEPGRIYLVAPVENLEEVSFSHMSGVNEITPAGNVKVNLEDGMVSITGVEDEVKVRIYSVSGMLEAEYNVTTDTTINISETGSGVHIVNINGYSFKILTK